MNGWNLRTARVVVILWRAARAVVGSLPTLPASSTAPGRKHHRRSLPTTPAPRRFYRPNGLLSAAARIANMETLVGNVTLCRAAHLACSAERCLHERRKERRGAVCLLCPSPVSLIFFAKTHLRQRGKTRWKRRGKNGNGRLRYCGLRAARHGKCILAVTCSSSFIWRCALSFSHGCLLHALLATYVFFGSLNAIYMLVGAGGMGAAPHAPLRVLKSAGRAARTQRACSRGIAPSWLCVAHGLTFTWYYHMEGRVGACSLCGCERSVCCLAVASCGAKTA